MQRRPRLSTKSPGKALPGKVFWDFRFGGRAEIRKVVETAQAVRVVHRSGVVQPRPSRDVTTVSKTQIDWLSLQSAGIRPTRGRTFSTMKVCGGSQLFNVVNALRVLGRCRARKVCQRRIPALQRMTGSK